MNVYAVLMGIAAVAYIVNKVYRIPGKVVFTESDNKQLAKLLDVNQQVIDNATLDNNQQLVLQETSVSGDVLVKAKTNSGAYEVIGHVNDPELYKKVQQKRARAKISVANANEIIIEYSFS